MCGAAGLAIPRWVSVARRWIGKAATQIQAVCDRLADLLRYRVQRVQYVYREFARSVVI